ncbi:hypothetical protein LSTR_LSTR000206 [Laodelphax striatellus]|uniref:Uncharacterized protein n=1 Tax=Laodelphax striatellus TaxID=195883 RepID=A0A482X725_LAOST|nr:hypothetical protein LSTR_LSTR000206 [Laodelphax striatellus]
MFPCLVVSDGKRMKYLEPIAYLGRVSEQSTFIGTVRSVRKGGGDRESTVGAFNDGYCYGLGPAVRGPGDPLGLRRRQQRKRIEKVGEMRMCLLGPSSLLWLLALQLIIIGAPARASLTITRHLKGDLFSPPVQWRGQSLGRNRRSLAQQVSSSAPFNREIFQEMKEGAGGGVVG